MRPTALRELPCPTIGDKLFAAASLNLMTGTAPPLLSRLTTIEASVDHGASLRECLSAANSGVNRLNPIILFSQSLTHDFSPYRHASSKLR